MIDRTYKCDLCRDRSQDNQLVGLFWGAGNRIEIRASHDVEHHICQKCLAGLAEIWKSVRESLAERGEE